jgi:hypothetical protein
LAIHGWHDALYRAYKRDTPKLAAYLRSDLPLDKDKREALADLIDRRIHRKAGSGRKPGRIPPRNPDEITVGLVVTLARSDVESMRQRNGGTTPRGAYRAAILRVCKRLGDDGSNVNIDVDEALHMMRRGKQRRNHRRN